jgi:hypothetical protein
MFSANLAVYANAYMDPPGMRNPMTDDIRTHLTPFNDTRRTSYPFAAFLPFSPRGRYRGCEQLQDGVINFT